MMLRVIALSLSLIAGYTHAMALDLYMVLNHLDNYGNLDLRGKPYTSLPENFTIKGNLNIAKTAIKSLPKDTIIEGSLDASNSLLEKVPRGTSIKATPTYSGPKFNRGHPV